MKIQKAIWKETVHITLGVVVLSVLMQLVFLLIGKWDMTVLCGTLLGSTYSILNFFILGLTVQKVANEGNEKQGKNWMQFSYSCRMMGTMLVVFMGLSMPWFNWVAVFLPQLFPRITIAAMGFTGKKAKEATKEYDKLTKKVPFVEIVDDDEEEIDYDESVTDAAVLAAEAEAEAAEAEARAAIAKAKAAKARAKVEAAKAEAAKK